jgi:DNA methylase
VKRSLTNIGGEVKTGGDPKEAALLAHALDVGPDEDEHRAHVHGFHTYAARMHPLTAARLAKAFAEPGGVVFDPFCGSGTVLVEAMIAGADAIGTDLNPLAIRLAGAKTRPRDDSELEALMAAAREVAAHADARRKARAGASRRYSPEDVHLFEPHVLLELDSLRVAVRDAKEPARADLELVLSAILVKLSKKRGDTSDKTEGRRIGAGYPAKLFVKKTEEWIRRLTDFRRLLAALPSPTPTAKVDVDDAGVLRTLTKTRHPRRPTCIITSPPYAATYDYVAHHALRLRWLGLDARDFERGEMGARRNYTELTGPQAQAFWEEELARFFDATARVLLEGAPMVLLMADSAVGRHALRADDVVAAVAREHDLRPIARASQTRPHFHSATTAAFHDAPRREHALLLRRA